MARSIRKYSPTGYYHWINRGIHRKAIFHKKADFHVFLCILNEYRCHYNIKVHHYCIMDNHIHLLIHSDSPSCVSSFSRDLQRRYSLHHSKQYKWIGRTFQDRYKSLPIKHESHLLACARYIERNPIEAKKVRLAQDYAYSSFKAYYEGIDPYGLIEPTDAYLELGRSHEECIRTYAKYVNESQEYDDKDLRDLLVG
jgi:putative transposase